MRRAKVYGVGVAALLIAGAIELGDGALAGRSTEGLAASAGHASRAPRSKGRRRVKLKKAPPPMELEHLNHREKLTVQLYDRKGRVTRPALQRLTRFLRCVRTGRRHKMNPRLLANLHRVSRAFPGRTIYVYSGFRHKKVAALKTSHHTRGEAVDFRVEGLSNRKLRDYLLANLEAVGVGYYPNSPFVHMDVREKRAFWVDYSGSGEPARYAKDAYEVLKGERDAARGRRVTAALPEAPKVQEQEREHQHSDAEEPIPARGLPPAVILGRDKKVSSPKVGGPEERAAEGRRSSAPEARSSHADRVD
ncbi:MAG: YcbK family protein [Deltaproteobacteria bacterium]|nr:YcbK family protein [Deltaproteobacteria bacterium]